MGQGRGRREEGRNPNQLTLLLSERDVEGLLKMDEVVFSVEEAFRRQSEGEAENFMRTRTKGRASILSVMHASLSYLGRGGLKCYTSSRKGTRFAFILFDSSDSKPLAVMGADVLGRYRTGAASAVATKHLYGRRSARLAVCGSGKQALTQVLALASVVSVHEVRVWSPTREHRKSFAEALGARGFDSTAFDSAAEALEGADVVSAITSSTQPFIDGVSIRKVSHLNICGSNTPDRFEIAPSALGAFGTIVVDDLAQAKVEYGDLIQGVKAGTTDWGKMVELKDVVGGRMKPRGKTLFKSGGVALEDVAVGSMVYDKAVKTGRFSSFEFELG
ncbi:MAG: ornithine cyclodeaminase family protein [Thaumarchaeota archaeon]|nr:ornithine cyclodeaminase family protein [Nitrososphaerota archaeon]